MYFADFNNLKIITDYNYITKSITLPVHAHMPAIEFDQMILDKLSTLEKERTSLPVLYDFTIATAENDDLKFDEIEDVVSFLTACANLIVAHTLRYLETGKGYKRERRLDVPEKLKPLHASYGAIKRACNNEIITPIINIKVNFSGMCYLLCMGREVDEVRKEFINE